MRAQLASIQVFLSVIAVTDNGFDLALLSQLPGTAQLFGPGRLVCRVSGGDQMAGHDVASQCRRVDSRYVSEDSKNSSDRAEDRLM